MSMPWDGERSIRRKFAQRLITTAVKNKIPHQKRYLQDLDGCLDHSYSGRGIPCGGLYIPRRYSHSPVELVKWSDVEKTAELLYLFLKDLNSSVMKI